MHRDVCTRVIILCGHVHVTLLQTDIHATHMLHEFMIKLFFGFDRSQNEINNVNVLIALAYSVRPKSKIISMIYVCHRVADDPVLCSIMMCGAMFFVVIHNIHNVFNSYLIQIKPQLTCASRIWSNPQLAPRSSDNCHSIE